MGNVSRAFCICQGYLRRECRDFQTYFMLVIMLVLSHMCMEEVIQFSYRTEYRITPWSFVFFSTSRIVRLVFEFVFLSFICNLPFREKNDQFFLLRSGRRAFCIGNMFYAFVNACLYTFILAISGFIWGLPEVEWSVKWGKILGTLAMTDAGKDFTHAIVIHAGLVQREEPAVMMCYAVLLSICSYFLLGLVMILCNLIGGKRNIGILVCGILILTDFLLQSEPLFWRGMYLSPVSWSNLSKLDIRGNDTVFPSLSYALAGYVVLITVLTAIIIKNSSRMNLNEGFR